jgi:hypothetical protein
MDKNCSRAHILRHMSRRGFHHYNTSGVELWGIASGVEEVEAEGGCPNTHGNSPKTCPQRPDAL